MRVFATNSEVIRLFKEAASILSSQNDGNCTILNGFYFHDNFY